MHPTFRHAALGAALAGSTATAALAAMPAGAALSSASRAPVTVTIRAEGTDLSGAVQSRRPICEVERNVIVFKQVGTRGGGDDVRFAMDTSGEDGEWSTGNTGTPGRFYAAVRRTPQCRAATSPTIRASR